ncbi:MAG: hypothetical protein EB138_05715 [Actinobacteria bacterium]|nr:hypothetical protein [Actinomycetota bacterium]
MGRCCCRCQPRPTACRPQSCIAQPSCVGDHGLLAVPTKRPWRQTSLARRECRGCVRPSLLHDGLEPHERAHPTARRGQSRSTRRHHAASHTTPCQRHRYSSVRGAARQLLVHRRVEDEVAKALNLRAVPATQVISRDRHAEFLAACASIASTIEMIAVELRHLQRTEVAEVREGFAVGQKGSSAMPHKRNPISAETLSGLARVVRGNLQAGLQNVALWHERDISHSSVERIILPDTAQLTYYMTKRLTRLVATWEVDVDQMRTNLELTHGAVFSQSVLLALVEAGLGRDAAYRLVQEASRRAHDSHRHLRDVLAESTEVTAALDGPRLTQLFEVQRVLRHADRAVAALDELSA